MNMEDRLRMYVGSRNSVNATRATDQYSQRAHIIREIVEGIRARVTDPHFVIGIKINSVEFQAKGFQVWFIGSLAFIHC
jgi:2,4-dienoyl-CoA reductase-like NADH-dependent reductase (Old Yellow Enzyme family)